MRIPSENVLLDKANVWSQKLGKYSSVEAIFLSGSLAQGRASKSSDIDFFIIARPGQIWTARFLVFLKLKLHKQISTEKDHAGKICPNHFITSDNLEIEEKDAYSAHLFSQNKPLYDPNNFFVQFVQVNQSWVQRFGESFPPITMKQSHILENRKLIWWKRWIEVFLRWIQIRKIQSNPDFSLPGAKIVTSDTELRFHPKPKNKAFRKEI